MYELGYVSFIILAIFCDKLSAITYSANLVFQSKMKHLAIHFHYVYDKVKQGTLQVSHIFVDNQLVDALTKPLPRPRFHELLSKIGLINGSSIFWGHDK